MDNRYPTDDELNKIKNWDVLEIPPIELIEFIRSIWWTPEWGFKLKGKTVLRLELHCGGWSGNEDIINALERNIFFYAMYWKMSRAGGHHYFTIRPMAKEKKK